jgi:hypothetical protein
VDKPAGAQHDDDDGDGDGDGDHEGKGVAGVEPAAAAAAAAAAAFDPFIWANVNTDERLKSATMRKYEAQAAAVWLAINYWQMGAGGRGPNRVEDLVRRSVFGVFDVRGLGGGFGHRLVV